MSYPNPQPPTPSPTSTTTTTTNVVVQAPGTPHPDSLAFTGGDVLGLSAIALVAIIVGASMTRRSRRLVTG